MRPLSPFLSVLLMPLLAAMPLQAELAHASSNTAGSAKDSAGATTPAQSNLLKIRLADDSKATVQANTFVNGYSVAVSDAAGLPVADAAVAIRFPEDGVTAFFINGEHSAVAYTDQAGVAKFPQVNWGQALGTVSIRVTAIKGDLHAGALIEQTIVAPVEAASVPGSMATPISPAGPVAPVTILEAGAETIIVSTPDRLSPAAPSPSPAHDAKRPGSPSSVAALASGASVEEPAIAQTGTTSAPLPAVSVVTTGGSQTNSHSNRKWVILAAVVAGAGVGLALALSAGKGGAGVATSAAATTTIGTPTISLGH